jgi:hypothetical protein
MSTPSDASRQAVALARELGAAEIAHPGGTLLAHLQRVHDRLGVWGARPALRLAGLCHAFYGTDGFPTALLPLDRRSDLAAVIGVEAEELAYFYGSCDRKSSYPGLTEADAVFRDRFTDRTSVPDPSLLRDFAELTAANELDLAAISPDFREQWGDALLAMFTRFRPLLSPAAWSDCRTVLGAPRP